KQDELEFENPFFAKFLSLIVDLLKNEAIVDLQDYFTNHEDQEIRNFTADLIANQHEISLGWNKHSVFPKAESQKMTQLVNRTLLPYKLKKIEKAISEVKTGLKETEEKLNELRESLGKDGVDVIS